MRIYKRMTNKERLLKMSSEKNSNGCILWLGNKNKDGYGLTKYNGKTITAHRASFLVDIGPIENGLFVLHSCDVAACINPEHLHLGTQAQNRRECVERGRGAPQHGEFNPMAKLTTEQVVEIKKLLHEAIDRLDIAARFGVCKETISSIKTGKRWAHVSMEVQ